MKPHKHAELIKAWADGAEIEFFEHGLWHKKKHDCWYTHYEYRIKPEPKPDRHIHFKYDPYARMLTEVYAGQRGNLLVTLDGETGKLKLAEVLK